MADPAYDVLGAPNAVETGIYFKLAQNSFQKIDFHWIIITTLYHLMLRSLLTEKKLPNHFHFRDTISYHSNSITC